MREQVRSLVTSRRWEITITVIILVNALLLGLETSDPVMARAGELIRALDLAILSIFVVEIALRIYAHGWRFFKQPWSIFDFLVVAIALVPATGPLQVLRALRILRVVRLISTVPSLRRVIGGLLAALPGMGSIILLLALVFYVFAVMATNLYGDSFPEFFGTVPASLYSLFQIMTLESWSMAIVRPVMDAHPSAWAFFVPFIVCTAFTVLNLFIGVIVSAMQQETDALAAADREALHTESSAMMDELRALRAEVSEIRKRME